MATPPTAAKPKTPEEALKYFRTGPDTLKTLAVNGFKIVSQTDYDDMVTSINRTKAYFLACAKAYEEHGSEPSGIGVKDNLDLLAEAAQTAITKLTGTTPAASS